MSKASKAAKARRKENKRKREDEARRIREEQEERDERKSNQRNPTTQMNDTPPPANPVTNNQEQQPSPQASTQAAPSQDPRESPRRTDWAVWWQVVFSACLVVFTAVQAATSYYQWDATNKQYDAMVRQVDLMMIDQRPWIDIEAPSIPVLVRGNFLEYEVSFVNRGKTPAYVETLGYVAEMHDRLEPESPINMHEDEWLTGQLDWGDRLPGQAVIAPGSEFRIKSNVISTEKITADTLAKIADDRLIVRFAFRVRYRDSGGEKHVTERWFVSANGSVTGSGSNGKMD